MAKWQRKLDLRDIAGDNYDSAEFAKIAGKIGERLKFLAPFGIPQIDEDRDELADELADIAAHPKAFEESDLNYLMDRLYDWADTKLDNDWNGKAVCWVETR